MKRQGFTALEIVVALLVLLVPCQVVMDQLQGNVRLTRHAEQFWSVEHIMEDLVGILEGKEFEELQEIARSRGEELDFLLENRIAALPEHWRDLHREALQPLFGRLSLEIKEEFGGLPGLVRLELVADLENRKPLRILSFVRPGSLPRFD